MRQSERAGTIPDPRWGALQRRDPLAEGRFVYAVITTGVYCRPTCPSRLPHFQNVRFFLSTEEARRAGFRPCKRCKPDSTPEGHAAAAITKAAGLIEAAESAPDFKAIAEAAGMSRHHFHRTFKRLLGLTPGAYYRSLRERRAVEVLSAGSTVTQAIYEAGYGSSSRFYEKLAPRLGMHPSAFAKGGSGEVIRFAIGECSLGSILAAATAKGVCAIELGDDPGVLAQNFQDRFPNAGLIAGDARFEEIMAQAIGLVEDPGRNFGLPLHIRGTAFQLKVWEALRALKPGETASYKELAAKTGLPRAVRAVARACASNKIAVAIPCHRIVRTDGSLSGYRWGVERKAKLLAREKAED
jgi:AraC family transcriptional regulator, regulatory protein of adaptative response / methylated-DNA-[protein]-cysteine methyltransferase